MGTLVDLDVLRGLAWSLWDPLCLDGVAPRDEYDSYLLGLVGIVRNGGGDEEADAYLVQVEEGRLGVMDGRPAARVALIAAVRKLVDGLPVGRLKFR